MVRLMDLTASLSAAFGGKRVFITGHTGFKGSWLALWLKALGAEVHGLALEPETNPSLFDKLGLEKEIDSHNIADIRNAELVRNCILSAAPDYLFHLAAQPLVRRSYTEPVETYATNVMGTLHVMEAMRLLEKPSVGVMVTTDKCYENQENARRYREDDPLGGYDPYSSSKACAEIAIASWRRSFWAEGVKKALASGRAGNVIGGGDWSEDRIIPDVVKHLAAGEAIPVRSPWAVRPWQHVLDPLLGYLMLAQRLGETTFGPEGGLPDQPENLQGAYNFGPHEADNRTVQELVEYALKHWPGKWEDCSDPNAPHEAKLLHLDATKAQQTLGWRPTWDFAQAVEETILWYREAENPAADMRAYSLDQIARFSAKAVDKATAR